MPDDDQDGAPDRDDGTLPASSFRDALIAFAEEGIGSAGDHRSFTKDSGQVAVAMPGGMVALGCRPNY